MPNFQFKTDYDSFEYRRTRGDPVIQPCEGYKSNLSHITVAPNTDIICSTSRKELVYIPPTSPTAGLVNGKRLKDYTDGELEGLARVVDVSVADLKEVRDLAKVPFTKK